jgi:hypothetical protein
LHRFFQALREAYKLQAGADQGAAYKAPSSVYEAEPLELWRNTLADLDVTTEGTGSQSLGSWSSVQSIDGWDDDREDMNQEDDYDRYEGLVTKSPDGHVYPPRDEDDDDDWPFAQG